MWLEDLREVQLYEHHMVIVFKIEAITWRPLLTFLTHHTIFCWKIFARFWSALIFTVTRTFKNLPGGIVGLVFVNQLSYINFQNLSVKIHNIQSVL